MRKTLLFMCACAMALNATATQYVGGDISMLTKYEQNNSAYLDPYGKEIPDLIPYFVNKCKWNTFRVRIFVNPAGGSDGVIQNTEYVAALGKRIKDAGAYFMLDFHYSDTWVDATHIQAPAAWAGKSDAAMADSVAAYTHRTLQTLKAAGATPDLVQVGNEIMYGLCGIKVAPYANSSSNWTGYLGLLKAGCDAVRNECPQAQIIIHTDRPTNIGYNQYYYQKLVDANIDFDVIGLSYYPFWHGWLTEEQNAGQNLVMAINRLNTDFPSKRVQIVECAYNFQYWPSAGVNTDTRSVWECSKAGQYQFVHDLVDALKPLANVDGINYWFPEEAGNGDNGTVYNAWLNRGFWSLDKSSTGHTINMTKSSGVGQNLQKICAPYYMQNFYRSEEGIDAVQNDSQTQKAQKELRNGQLIIRRGEKIYTPAGIEIQ